jgi:hypothetical protein
MSEFTAILVYLGDLCYFFLDIGILGDSWAGNPDGLVRKVLLNDEFY